MTFTRPRRMVNNGSIDAANYAAVMRLAMSRVNAAGPASRQAHALLLTFADQELSPQLRHRLGALLAEESWQCAGYRGRIIVTRSR